jgi:hypothetical protein
LNVENFLRDGTDLGIEKGSVVSQPRHVVLPDVFMPDL